MARKTGKKTASKKRLLLTAVLWKEGRQFVSKCPELGLASCGRTLDEATSNLKEAVELYIENAEKLGILKDLLPTLTSVEKFTTTLSVDSP